MQYPSNGPMLAMSEKIEPKDVTLPSLVSIKMDGFRCIMYSGRLFTRSLKLHPNQKLVPFFKDILKYTEKHDVVFDGELWDAESDFCETSSVLRSFTTEVPDNLQYYVFDMLPKAQWDQGSGGNPFNRRVQAYKDIIEEEAFPNVIAVDHLNVDNTSDLIAVYNDVLRNGHEGLICRQPLSYYKHGRVVPGKPTMVKLKAVETHDAVIVELKQGRKLRKNVERERDLKGHLKRPHSMDDYVLDNMLGSFVVDFNNKRFSVGCGQGLTAKDKRYIWANRDSYIGRVIEFECLAVGEKDVPRMGKFKRFRDDKESA